MLNKFDWPLWHWHFEISSICTLKCPRCPRTELPESLVQTQLKLDFFKKNFNLPTEIKKITFCGDDGDPIYARDLIPVVDFFKTINPEISITIITNGSYKSPDWWKELGKVLNHRDQVRFSLDGWDQESNSQYRINSDWKSILAGIIEFKKNSTALTCWDAIAFSFNQNNIEKMKELAKTLGFDEFQLTKSTKFGKKYQHYQNSNGVDTLEPDDDFISSSHRFERELFNFSGKKINNVEILKSNMDYYKKVKEKSNGKKITPLCFIGTKGLYVNSQGYLIPCCWVGNRYNHTGLNNFLIPENNIMVNGLEKVLNGDHWNKFIDQFDYMNECNSKCMSKLVNEEYATNW